MTIKIITIKKRGGGTRKQKVQVLKSGKFKFIKNSTKVKRSAPKRKAPKRKAPKRKAPKTTKRKVIKPNKRRGNVVSRKGISKITGNPTLRKVLMAAGAVSVVTSVAALVAPQFVPTIQKPIVRAALGFVTGDFIGAASNFVIGGGLPSMTNGNGNGGSTNAGFA